MILSKKNIVHSLYSALSVSTLLTVLFLASCAKQTEPQEMSVNELSDKAFASLKKKHLEEATKYLEEIITRFPDHAKISKYKILLAETYYKLGKYPAAHELYDHFNQFYPADSRAELAKYRSILAMFYQTLNTDCDQTPTTDTVRLCQEYLSSDTYKKYRKDVTDIQRTCENKLIDKEVYVFNFYLHQESYDAARGRLKYLREKYLASNPKLEDRLLYLECKLAKREKDKMMVKQNLEKLLKEHPDSKFTQMAQALTTKKVFVF